MDAETHSTGRGPDASLGPAIDFDRVVVGYSRARHLGEIVSGHMMTRRGFLAGVVNLLAAPCVADAQATGQRHRVGLLNGSTPGRAEAAFRESLRGLGS